MQNFNEAAFRRNKIHLTNLLKRLAGFLFGEVYFVNTEITTKRDAHALIKEFYDYMRVLLDLTPEFVEECVRLVNVEFDAKRIVQIGILSDIIFVQLKPKETGLIVARKIHGVSVSEYATL